jgi:2-polyprenyl-3-methyl-5-hydroxy-6-metoxy-1,4-benzoquinol methylase
VYELLKSLGLVTRKNLEKLKYKCRDNQSVSVYRDKSTRIIYIDDYYVGDDEYIKGEYRKLEFSLSKSDRIDKQDTLRRVKICEQYLGDGHYAELGCGYGHVIRDLHRKKVCVQGVELQKNYIDSLLKEGINCAYELDDIEDNSIELFGMFHVLEHLEKPIEVLTVINKKIKENGYIVVEVPNAMDFLMEYLNIDEFYKHTLWSQHLILHTKNSLKKFMEESGFTIKDIYGVQRYPISNQLYWCLKGKPGGHETKLNAIDNRRLHNEYEKTLDKIDATDTLFAICQKI